MNLRLKNTKRLDQRSPNFLWQQATPLIAGWLAGSTWTYVVYLGA